jgi:hypothetical protein
VFTDNRCDPSGPDISGGAVRPRSQYHGLPVYVIKPLHSQPLQQRWRAEQRRRLMEGGQEPFPRQPRDRRRGQSGPRSLFLSNQANEGGGAIFFVSNDRTGTMAITSSTLERNRDDRLHTSGLPKIYFLGARRPAITGSVLR